MEKPHEGQNDVTSPAPCLRSGNQTSICVDLKKNNSQQNSILLITDELPRGFVIIWLSASRHFSVTIHISEQLHQPTRLQSHPCSCRRQIVTGRYRSNGDLCQAVFLVQLSMLLKTNGKVCIFLTINAHDTIRSNAFTHHVRDLEAILVAAKHIQILMMMDYLAEI